MDPFRRGGKILRPPPTSVHTGRRLGSDNDSVQAKVLKVEHCLKANTMNTLYEVVGPKQNVHRDINVVARNLQARKQQPSVCSLFGQTSC